ncbi:MAG: hypothetical protein ABJB12_08305, partial [Pseudomonadota bacterium]
GAGANCRALAEPCANGADCCSGACDAKLGCVASSNQCSPAGGACTVATECCSLSCVGGACSADSCISDGKACTANADCCGGVCGAGKTCTALNDSCKTAGNECTGNTQCCSGLCDGSKHCQLASSFCTQPGDTCAKDGDCCTGNCTIASGKTVGTCGAPPTGPSYCTKIDGELCTGCGDCCSRLCAPGPAGVNICQPANGCHVTGDLCKKDTDCCGGDAKSGLPGAGNGSCQLDASGKIGICINPMNGGSNACNPEGNVCHYLQDQNYSCSSSSARSDCCGPDTPKFTMCKLDGLGVPRCLGVGDCKAASDTCASTADCCDKAPCVPDATGKLHCLPPPDGGGPLCVPTNGACTINADCCPGGICNRLPGSTSGTCTVQPPPPNYGGSGGTSGTGGSPSTGGAGGYPTCSEYGQICAADSDCCNGVPCTGGACVYLVK